MIIILKNYQKSLKENFSAKVKIQENILAFQYQLKENMILTKQLHTK